MDVHGCKQEYKRRCREEEAERRKNEVLDFARTNCFFSNFYIFVWELGFLCMQFPLKGICRVPEKRSACARQSERCALRRGWGDKRKSESGGPLPREKKGKVEL